MELPRGSDPSYRYSGDPRRPSRHVRGYIFQPDSSLETDAILDFCKKSAEIQICKLWASYSGATKNICHGKRVRVVFDSFCELSVKEGVRVRKPAKSGGTI